MERRKGSDGRRAQSLRRRWPALRRGLVIGGGAAGVALLGWWLGATATRPSARPEAVAPPRDRGVVLREIPAPRPLPTKAGRRAPKLDFDLDALANGALAGQRTLTFRDEESMRRFLESLDGSGLRLLGVIPQLRTVRVGFDDLAALLELPDDLAETGFIFPVFIPELPEPGAQPGAAGLGNQLLAWLGVSGDVSGWGRGVKIAILDTGVSLHPAILARVLGIELVPWSADGAAANGHGTAVASLIAGAHPLVPGVAPGADLLSIRVADDFGMSDSFLLAQGILAAVEAGAQIINISMGSFGDSNVLWWAVESALNAGVVVIASAGNNGLDTATYPAAYNGVLAIGAVDANGSHLAFSNASSTLAAAAPGYGVNAAWPGDAFVAFSGTSASAPIMAGVIAATMSQGTGVTMSANQAVGVVVDHLNEAGAPGADPLYGAGLPDLGRVMRRNDPSVVDAAVASIVASDPGSAGRNPLLLVTVENRGTTTLVNSSVTVSSPAGTTPLNVTTLGPGQIHTFQLPLPVNASDPLAPMRVHASISTGSGQFDAFPGNNTRVDTLALDPGG